MTLLAAVAVAACTFQSTSVEETRFRCGVDDACPVGFSCVDDFCEASGGDVDAGLGADAQVSTDGAPGTDATTTTDGGTTSDGGVVAVFEDGFDDGVMSGWLGWDHPGCTVTERGGVLELSFDGTGDAYCGADTGQRFDLRDGAVTVEVAAAPAIGNFETYLALFNNQQQIQMLRDASGLIMRLKINNTFSKSATVANDTVGQRFWRIREQAGTIYWDTSPDGVSWTNRHSAAATIDASALQIELAAGQYSTGPGQPVLVHFDRLAVF